MNDVNGLPTALMPVWRAVHARLSSGKPVKRIRVGPLSDEQRVALADLLGASRLPDEYAYIALSALDAALQDSCGQATQAVLAKLVGPLGDQAADRAQSSKERSELWDWLFTHPVLMAQPVLQEWAEFVRRAGLVGGSVSRTRRHLEGVLRVLAALPAEGVPLPVFADAILDDPHALDEGNPVFRPSDEGAGIDLCRRTTG